MTIPGDIPLPDMPPGPSPEEILFGALIKRATQLNQIISDAGQELAAIKMRMRDLGEGQHEYATGKITITPQRRFDPELAATVLRSINPDLVATCSVSKVDAGLVKKVVGSDVYERCQKPSGEHKVSIS